MKRFSEQFNKQSKSIRLSAVEKRDLKERLTAYMEYHPLPQTVKERPIVSPMVSSEPFRVVRINFSQIGSVFGALAMIVLIVVPVIAERTVPGDVLYPVKVRFNEEVRSTLTLSPYEKVEWETERLERRIAEARLLASEGKLTDEMQVEVAAAVKQHSTAAQEEIAAITAEDSDEGAMAGIAFNAALEVQSEVLENDLERGIAGDEVAHAVSEVRATSGAQPVVQSYEKLLARLELETTNASEYFNSIEEVIDERERADIERRLEDIARKVVNAAALHEDEEVTPGAAVAVLSQALADTRKLISFLTDIDVKENVTIEELVPVTLTEGERVTKLTNDLDSAQTMLAEVQTLIMSSSTDLNVAQKAGYYTAEVVEQLTRATAATLPDELEAVEPLVADILAQLTDLKIMLGAVTTPGELEKVVTKEDKASSTDPVLEEVPTESATSTASSTAVIASTTEAEA